MDTNRVKQSNRLQINSESRYSDSDSSDSESESESRDAGSEYDEDEDGEEYYEDSDEESSTDSSSGETLPRLLSQSAFNHLFVYKIRSKHIAGKCKFAFYGFPGIRSGPVIGSYVMQRGLRAKLT